MKQILKQGRVFLLALIFSFGPAVTGASAAADAQRLDAVIDDTAAYLLKTVTAPQVGSIGGEWAVLGLARSGYDVPVDYFQDYYATVEAYVEACKGNLHDKKYTEYSRVILALSAIGKDARDVAGYDLTLALGDYDKTILQGLSGPIWALIALDARDYPMPQNPQAKTQATRQMYIDRILDCQRPDGGWSLSDGTADASPGGGVSDPNITGMALQALAKYQDQPPVAQACREALACMSSLQDDEAGFSSWETRDSESCVQMIVALCELGIPLDDSRFVKNGKTMLDNLLDFYTDGNGFTHTIPASGSDQMATEQGFYAMVAVKRLLDGKSSLYRMGDASAVLDGDGPGQEKGAGLAGKAEGITGRPITKPGATFEDISAHKNQSAIEALAARDIVSGKGNGAFDPDGGMTRAEFAAITVKALGLTPKANDNFCDVPPDAWYAGVVGTASGYGIVNGSNGAFSPLSPITRQEAAVMVCNAAKLCGMDTGMDSAAVRDTLAQFTDYVTTAQWARPGLAFCYSEDILDQSDLTIRPSEPATRGEIAQMLFNLLGRTNLL